MKTIDQDGFKSLVEEIAPLDDAERMLQKNCIQWILSGEELFRIKRPNIPPKHWIVYMPILDLERGLILLGDHIKANLWLPAGGHVDPWEHPRETALRELREEFFIHGEFINDKPFMLSSNVTLIYSDNPDIKTNHEDVALWYLFKGDSKALWKFDEREFRSLKWFAFDALPKESDPNMDRFMSKLKLI